MPRRATSTEELWELLSDRLRSFLRRHADNDEEAEDLLQETFLRIHGGLDDLRDDERLESWVFRIARNLLADRRRAARLPSSDTADSAAAVTEPAPPDDENLNAEVLSWLPAMIDRLPVPYRAAVRRFELEGVPQHRIAEELGLSLSGAKSRVQRGREKLKELLFDCCAFERDRRGNVIGYERRAGGCGDC